MTGPGLPDVGAAHGAGEERPMPVVTADGGDAGTRDTAGAANVPAARADDAQVAFSRRVDAFARQVTVMRRRLAALRQRVGDDGPPASAARAADLPGDVLDDVLDALEALQVAEEELLVQHHALAAAQLALDQERERYAELFASAPDAYLVTRTDGHILEANRAAVALLNAPAETLTGKPLPVYVGADDRGALRALLNSVGEQTRVDETVLRVTPRGGAPVPVAATATVVRDAQTGAATAIRWSLRDVSARVQADEALRQLNAELDARVAERARELEARTRELEARGRELAEQTADAEGARRRAEAADRAKSEFLATMSHELRTPINAMVGYTQLLDMGLAGPVTAQQRDYLSRLSASSEHLLALVNDVLDLARLDAGRMPVVREPATTARVVEAALALTLPLAEAKGVRLVDESAGTPGVGYVGDETRVRQIVVNLSSNAVKFTPPGGTVSVACGVVSDAAPGARLSGGGPWAFLRVSDTGMGIAPAHQAAIFEPFTQAEQVNEVGGRSQGPYRRTQGGTGLGLTVSRRLARLMGGDLTVESELGRGATFTLWLPAPAADAADGSDPERPGERGARALRAAASYRVHGLAEIGEYLRERVGDVLEAYAARLRRDPGVPRAAALRRSDLEDHQLSFLADAAQSLVVIEETGGLASELLRDGSAIQRVVAELHGRARHRQGWTEDQLEREYAILGEELEALVRRRVPDGTGDASTALGVLRRLVERAAVTARRALRHAARHGS